MLFDAGSWDYNVRAYRAFDSAYTSGKVWFMFTVRTQYGGDEDAKSFGAQFMSTAGDSSTIFASVGKPPSRYSSNPRLAITTSKDGSGFPTTTTINNSKRAIFKIKFFFIVGPPFNDWVSLIQPCKQAL